MRLRLTVCGWELDWMFTAGREDIEEPAGITGGSSLYTERDLDPPDPANEEPWYEDRKFGFQ